MSVRYRFKGSSVYVEPGTFRVSEASLGAGVGRARADSAYQTTGTGVRSRAWPGSSFGPNLALDYEGDQLRKQSRELVRKNAIAGAAVDRIVTNVVGTGIRPKAPNTKAQALWNKWTDESAVDGQLDFYGQQGQAVGSLVAAGECFVRMRTRRPSDGLTVPFQIEILESEFCPTSKNEVETDTRGAIRNGIEFDKNVKTKRVAYWMYRRHPGDGSAGQMDLNEPVRVPASEVLQLYHPTRPGQLRGEPWLTRALARLKDLEEYDGAELVRKKTAAMLVGFIRRQVPTDLTEDELKAVFGNDASVSDGIGQIALEPGTMQVLAPNEDVSFSDPKDVGGQYEVWMRMQLRLIAAAAGILYEQLTGDFSTGINDRTWRAAVSEFRRRCEYWQHHLVVYQLCRPIWRRWADLALLAGADVGDLDPTAAVPWIPQAWPYINPVQDVQARETEVKAGFTSRTAIVAERGEDAEEIDRQQAADNTRADGLKLKYSSDGRQAKATPPKPGRSSAPPPDDPDDVSDKPDDQERDAA